jgi:hypothetical protein
MQKPQGWWKWKSRQRRSVPELYRLLLDSVKLGDVGNEMTELLGPAYYLGQEDDYIHNDCRGNSWQRYTAIIHYC